MESKNKIYGIIGTILFHGLMFLILWVFALRTPLPLPEEQGMELMMETDIVRQSGGSSSPIFNERPAVSQPTSEKTQNIPVNREEPVATQETEESVIAATTPKQTTPSQPVVDARAIYRPQQPGTSTGSGNNSVDGTGSGQGAGVGTGAGDEIGSTTGLGSGDGWFLHGRKKMHLEKPTYNSKEQGIVVVEIMVDRTGNVTRAKAGGKVQNISTTVSDQTLWNLAQNAALQSKFSENPKAPEAQRGYIVYEFIKSH